MRLENRRYRSFAAKKSILLIDAVFLLLLPACGGQAERPVNPDFESADPSPALVVVADNPIPTVSTPEPTSRINTPTQTARILTPTATVTGVVRETQTPTQAAPLETTTPSLETTSTAELAPDRIQWNEAENYLGQQVTVCGPVAGAHFASSSRGEPTFLNLGEAYPSPNRFQVLIWGDQRSNFPGDPEELYLGETICVTGEITEYDGVFEITADEESDIIILTDNGE